MSSKKPKKPDGYMKYSSIAYQMLGILGVSGWIGYNLDKYFQNSKLYITAGLMLFMLVTYLWKISIEIINEGKKRQ